MNLSSRFESFWKDYEKAHSSHETKVVHFLATSWGLSFVLAAGLTLDASYLLWAIAFGYVPSWLAHKFIENNRPLSWRNPILSLLADLKLCYDLIKESRHTRHDARPSHVKTSNSTLKAAA